jgi:hypothetical protein
VTYDSATLTTLGGCKSAYQTHMYTIPSEAITTGSLCQLVNGTAAVNPYTLGSPSSVYHCDTANRMGETVS